MTYNPSDDGMKSYYAAIEAKRERGDAHYPSRSPIKREVVIGNCRLLLGDCLEILPLLGKVDAVVTDPPYGIGKDGQKKTTGGHGGRKGYEFKGWDTQRPPEEYFSTIIMHSATQIIWGGNYFADMLPARGRWLVWDKGQRINQSDCELAYTSQDGALRIFELNRVALLTDGAQHPTQKPIELMNWCLDFIPEAKTVCDPFMGSGSTGVSCVKRGKSFIGIEIDEGYFDIACRRIEDAVSRPDMFIETSKPETAVQQPLFPEEAA